MNDTNNNDRVLALFRRDETLSSSGIHEKLGGAIALITVKRIVSDLYGDGLLDRIGSGRSVEYRLTKRGLLLRRFDSRAYLKQDQTTRSDNSMFNYELFSPPIESVLSKNDCSRLEAATKDFIAKGARNDAVIRKELSRFIVEMSWKSARIEGNTYSLLDTEQLLLYGIKSDKNTEFETRMILNQKAAFDFVWDNREVWRAPTVHAIEEVHKLVIHELGVPRGLRQTSVGITGTDYTPIGNAFQLREALEQLLTYVDELPTAYEKALMLVLGLSYIQPFADGNKRTARMIANGVLLAHGYAPISYRAVDETEYKEACLIFYEQNSVQPFKQLFVEQYVYSATHYNIADAS
ncbi:MAG: Fic family protein [Candidatus Saccharimonadales bacterium]